MTSMELGPVRRVALSALVLALGAISTPSTGQTGTANVRTNMIGPTISEFRASPLMDGGSRIEGAPGPIAKGSLGEFEYALPKGSLAVFAKCAADRRCDRAAFVHALGTADEARAKRMAESLFAINQMYVGSPAEFMQIAPSKAKGFLLIQAFTVTNGWTAASLHRQYGIFLMGVAEANKTK